MSGGGTPRRRARAGDGTAPPPSRVHLVGAGPGAADLLTVRATRLLGEAELVVHDQLVTREVLALVPSGCEVVAAGRRQGRVVLDHERVVDLLAAAARRGLRVVRLKGGDPVVFGRGGEEAVDLAIRGVPTELVPGLTSAVAAPELAGIPLTHRGVAAGFLVLTGQRARGRGIGDEELELAARFSGTLVVLMATTRLGQLCRALREGGRAAQTPAALVAQAGRPEQQLVVGTLADLHRRVGDDPERLAPGVLVVGDVVRIPAELGRALDRAGHGTGRTSTAAYL